MTTTTIPKKLIKDDLLIVDRKSFEKMFKENIELRSAIKAVVEGELALRQGKTRSFRNFLKAKFPKHAQNH